MLVVVYYAQWYELNSTNTKKMNVQVCFRPLITVRWRWVRKSNRTSSCLSLHIKLNPERSICELRLLSVTCTSPQERIIRTAGLSSEQ